MVAQYSLAKVRVQMFVMGGRLIQRALLFMALASAEARHIGQGVTSEYVTRVY